MQETQPGFVAQNPRDGAEGAVPWGRAHPLGWLESLNLVSGRGSLPYGSVRRYKKPRAWVTTLLCREEIAYECEE
jgi:hypothetical protein